VFWLDLLTPLIGLNEDETEQALAALAEEPQIHPLEGLRVFDARSFRERLEWVRLTDVRKVTQRWETGGRPARPD